MWFTQAAFFAQILTGCVPEEGAATSVDPPRFDASVEEAEAADDSARTGDSAEAPAESALPGTDEPERTVIIGGGLAGLAAAMDLPGSLLLEASPALGGRAGNIGPRVFMFADSALQRAAHADVSVDEVLADWEAMTGSPPTAATQSFLEGSASVQDRMVAMGVSFGGPGPEPVTHVKALLATLQEGPELVQRFVDALPADVTVLTDTPATAILTDVSGIVGVQAGDTVYPTHRVVLATGGYVGRMDILEATGTWEAGTWTQNGEGGDGFAYDVAESLGLGREAIEATGAFSGFASGFSDGSVQGFQLNAPVIWVNERGERFVTEGELGSLGLQAAFAAQGRVLVLTNSAEFSAAIPVLTHEEAAAALHCYSDANALAAANGLNASSLAGTLADVEAVRTWGHDDKFNRDGAEFPDLTGEICVAGPGRAVVKAYAGVAVDDEGRALAVDGSVLPGLWVVGEAAGMATPGMGGRYGFDGSITAVVWSGWRAAASIQAEAGD